MCATAFALERLTALNAQCALRKRAAVWGRASACAWEKMRAQVGRKLVLGCWVAVAAVAGQPDPTNREPGRVICATEVGVYYSDSSPAVDDDGTIYVGAWNRRLFAFSPDGRVKWAFRALSEIRSTPAIGADGTVYFGSRDKHLYALSAHGKLKWRFRTGGWVDSSPAIGKDGQVYFGSWDKKFYALDPGGRKQWEFVTAGPIVSSPAIARDGTIYFGSHDAVLYALTLAGQKVWAFKTGGPILSSPAIGPDGTIVFTSTDGKLYALEPAGMLKWALWTGGVSEASPVIGPDGTIYCVATQHLLCVSADGQKKWEKKVSHHQWTDSTPVVTEDGGVYVFSGDGTMVSYSPAGVWRWQVWVGGGSSSSPAIGPNGRIYPGICSGKFRVLAGTNTVANSSWPMFRQNPKRTGTIPDAQW